MERTAKNPDEQRTSPKTKAGPIISKLYRCERCGTEIIRTKSGARDLWCCGEPMKLKEAKPLPSSD